MRAGVIGAGIGGLAAAVALARDGWEVAVLERDDRPGGAGTALGIWPGAMHALDALGLGGTVRARATPQERGVFRRPDGSQLATIDVDRLRRRTGDPVYLLSRPALLEILLDAVPAGVVRFGSPVSVDSVDADLVVAADGIFGRTRTDLFGPAYQARYTGSTAWRGWIDGRPTGEVCETWGRGYKFGVTPQEGGRTNWYAAGPAPEGDRRPGTERTELRRIFGGRAEPVRSVLAAVDEESILRHDLYAVPALPSFVSGRVALIGDAAHAMPPDLGRGACEAIVDAVALASALHDASTDAGSVADGLRRYDRARRLPVQRIARAAGFAGRLGRQRRLLWLRDTALRVGLRLPAPA